MDRQSYEDMQGKNQAIQASASMYFENNKDLMAAADFESAMKLGCFDKEFTYYGTAYIDDTGEVCYRISAQQKRLQEFVRTSVWQGYYPTPIMRYLSRRPAPSGHDENIKRIVKKETAQKIQKQYSATYFQALKQLSDVSPSNLAYPLLETERARLEGLYDAEQLQLFGGLIQLAADSKVLTLAAAMTLQQWLLDVEKQMEVDIIAKGQYKKVLSGFAYEDERGNLQYFYDAKSEVTNEEKAKQDRRGVFCTPVFVQEYWLRDMSLFPDVRRQFVAHLKELFAGGYLELYRAVKALPSVISWEQFAEQCKLVRENCSEEAYQTFLSYQYRWNIR